MKKNFGDKILDLMLKNRIRTAKDLADKINEEAGERIISPTSVGKWIAGKTVPKATSLMFLAKALKVSADLILSDEGSNPEQTKSLERMVSSIVKAEIEKTSKSDQKDSNNQIAEFLKSERVPAEDKKSILRQIENLLKLYKGGEKGD